MGKYDPAPYQLDLTQVPKFVTSEIPGPKSREEKNRKKVKKAIDNFGKLLYTDQAVKDAGA